MIELKWNLENGITGKRRNRQKARTPAKQIPLISTYTPSSPSIFPIPFLLPPPPSPPPPFYVPPRYRFSTPLTPLSLSL